MKERLRGEGWEKIAREKNFIKRKLYENLRGRCVFCNTALLSVNSKGKDGKKLPDNFPTIEHIKPRVDPKFGRNYSFSNLTISCFKCNHERGNRDFNEFLELKKKGISI